MSSLMGTVLTKDGPPLYNKGSSLLGDGVEIQGRD
jgi:hypothetical protein